LEAIDRFVADTSIGRQPQAVVVEMSDSKSLNPRQPGAKWGNEGTVPSFPNLDCFAENAQEGLIEFWGIVEFGSFGKQRVAVQDVCKIVE